MSCNVPEGDIFEELEAIHQTGFFSADISPEDLWQQVNQYSYLINGKKDFDQD